MQRFFKMSKSRQTYSYYLALLLLCIPLFFLNVRIVHPWGDDFAQYIQEADNIAHGKPYYETTWVFNDMNTEYAPPQYPPGYPLMLAPAVAMYGHEILPMMYVNTLIFCALLFALFAFFKRYMSSLNAVFLSVLIVYSDALLDLKGNLLSDVPCLLFVTVYLFLRSSSFNRYLKLCLVILAATMAILTRTQGVLLLAAEGLFLFVALIKIIFKKDRFTGSSVIYQPLLTIAGTSILYWVITHTVFFAPHSTEGFYKELAALNVGQWWQNVGNNGTYILDLSAHFFYYKAIDPFWQSLIAIIEFSTVVFMILGFIISIRKNWMYEHAFLIVMYLFFLVFPVHQGIRFLIEVMPVFFLFLFIGMREILPSVFGIKGRKLAIVFFLAAMIQSYDTLHGYTQRTCLGCLPVERDKKIFDVLKQRVDDKDLVLCNKPRPHALFTGKRTIIYAWGASLAENKKRFDSLGVKYILTGFDDRHNLENYIKATNCALDSQFIVDDFYLIRIRE